LFPYCLLKWILIFCTKHCFSMNFVSPPGYVMALPSSCSFKLNFLLLHGCSIYFNYFCQAWDKVLMRVRMTSCWRHESSPIRLPYCFQSP
jgi:hypothetical protein